MPKYLIESPHSPAKYECEQAIRAFLEKGSHYLSNAEWGCSDAVHKAWVIVETDTKEEARLIIPPPYREASIIVEIEKYGIDEVENKLITLH